MSATIRRIASLGVALVIGAAGAVACKVINPDHCANQEVPGNDWCSALSRSTPFCSPCVEAFHGCIAFEPFACAGYDPEVFGGDPDDDSSSGPATGVMTTLGGSDGSTPTTGTPTSGTGGSSSGG